MRSISPHFCAIQASFQALPDPERKRTKIEYLVPNLIMASCSVPDPCHFWYGDGSSDPNHWVADQDPALSFSDFQDAKKISYFYNLLKVHLHQSSMITIH
jgi:hypothetical protein